MNHVRIDFVDLWIKRLARERPVQELSVYDGRQDLTHFF